VQDGRGMLVVLLSQTGCSSEKPCAVHGSMGTREQSFAACNCFWPPGICCRPSERREEPQSQAEGVKPALHPSKSLQETPGVALNKPRARHGSAPKGAGDNSLQPRRWTQRAGFINRAFGGSSCHTSLKGCRLGEPPF